MEGKRSPLGVVREVCGFVEEKVLKAKCWWRVGEGVWGIEDVLIRTGGLGLTAQVFPSKVIIVHSYPLSKISSS